MGSPRHDSLDHGRTLTFLALYRHWADLQENTTAPEWRDICGAQYLFSDDTRSWADASTNCDIYGGHLLQLDDMSENYCLLQFSHAQGIKQDWYWHSGNDIMSEGVWRQWDGEMIVWQPTWDSSDPNGGTAQNCLIVSYHENAYAGKWADTLCTPLRHYVCERPKPPPAEE